MILGIFELGAWNILAVILFYALFMEIIENLNLWVICLKYLSYSMLAALILLAFPKNLRNIGFWAFG